MTRPAPSDRRNQEQGAARSVFVPFAVPEIRGEADIRSGMWREIMREGTRLCFCAGTVVPVEGEHLFDLFCIESGRVRVAFDTLEGRQRSVIAFEAGGIFNLACAMAQKEASGQYLCVRDSVVWRVPGRILRDARSMTECPELAAYALHALGTLALTYHTFLTDMLLDEFIVRFCRYLTSLALEHGRSEFPLGVTQDRCAAMLGVHRATLGRAIQQLKREHVLDCFTRKSVCILDMEKLRRMAGM